MTASTGALTLVGQVERVSYHNPQNGYTVVRVRTGEGEITAVGHFEALNAGETVELTGEWTQHPKHGEQFRVQHATHAAPSSLEGLAKYLGSGVVKGIGPALAARIVAAFGDETLTVIASAPERLARVSGVGARRAEAIAAAWRQQAELRELMTFLHAHGLSSSHAVRIHKTYGDDALAVVRTEPYRLAADVWGIGFATADQLAQRLGLARDADTRLAAGLLEALRQAAEDGHTGLPRAELLTRASRLLTIEPARLEPVVEATAAAGALVLEAPDWLMLPALHAAEASAAERLRKLVAKPAEVPLDLEQALAAIAEAHALSAEQQEAVRLAMTTRLCVLTGGPGTGKTTTVRALVALLAHYEQVIALASPTGRAAKRLSEVTGAEAVTLHRLLEFQPDRGGFARYRDRPVEADVVLVDEASMLDAPLFASLIAALPPLGRLVLVGDAAQLPSVGPGQVLADLIGSACVPVHTLTQVFRQAEASAIVANAHRIRAGEPPELLVPDGSARTDCYFVPADEPQEAARRVVNAVSKSLPARLGLAPDDIQVLAPTHRGPCGTRELNALLQAALNPPSGGPEAPLGERVLRVGDRVMQLRNDYERQVFNGDLGRVAAIEPEARTLTVQLLDREVVYDFADLDALALAYAISIHKSQGSEFPAVVLPLLPGPMLERPLLYTALTRAKRVAVLVGSRAAIETATRRTRASARHTSLARRLSQ